MQGADETSGLLFSYVDLEDRIPVRHPLQKIRQVVNDALASLDEDFDRLYVDFGRPSIAPERLIRASLIQILFSIPSERQLMEQMQYNFFHHDSHDQLRAHLAEFMAAYDFARRLKTLSRLTLC